MVRALGTFAWYRGSLSQDAPLLLPFGLAFYSHALLGFAAAEPRLANVVAVWRSARSWAVVSSAAVVVAGITAVLTYALTGRVTTELSIGRYGLDVAAVAGWVAGIVALFKVARASSWTRMAFEAPADGLLHGPIVQHPASR